MTRILTVIMLMLFSMGTRADVKVLFGEDGKELEPAKDGTVTLTQKELTGGTIVITQEDQKDGTFTVTLIVTPADGYTMAKAGPEVYAVAPADIASSSTRAIEASTKLDLKSDDYTSDSQKRTYTTTIDTKLALWVKTATFVSDSKGTSQRGADPYEGTWYITNTSSSNNYYLCPAAGYYNGNVETPYITTYQTGKDNNSIWTIEKVEIDDVTYYRIIHNATGKYITANDAVSGYDAAYVRLHLESFTTPTDATLFTIETYNGKQGIRSKDYDDAANNHYWFDISQGNQSNLWDNGKGALGFWYDYPITNNTNPAQAAPWTFQTATPVCATPVITYNESAENFSISYIGDDTDVAIHYTTDGSEPTAYSATYNGAISAASVTNKLRAIAVKTDYNNSEEAVVYGTAYSATPHLFKTSDYQTVDGVNSYYNFSYYLISPVDDDDATENRNYLTTSNVPNARMQWLIKPATASNGVQYHYLVNAETGKYIYFTGTKLEDGSKFVVKERDEAGTEDDRFMFRIWEGTADGIDYFNFSPKLFSAYPPSHKKGNFLCKQNNTNHNNPTGIYRDDNSYGRTRWQMVDVPADRRSLSELPAEMVSDASNCVYFKLRNATQDDSSNDYFVYPPSATTYATAATSGTNPEWYLAEASDADTWNTYYHIRNAQTGDYLYFDSNTKYNNNDNKFLTSRSITSGSEDKYKFLVLKTANTTYSGTWHIVPKAIRNNNNQANIALSRENKSSAKLRSSNSRDNNNACWYLDAVDFKCAAPSFLFASGKLSITSSTADAVIYYALGTSTPAISEENKYTEPITLSEGSSTVTAIAVRNTDGSDMSDPATFTMEIITSGSQITNMSGYYTLGSNFTPSADPIGSASNPFRGTIDGQMNTINGLSHPLFGCVENATIKNVILDNVNIGSGDDDGNTGAIACVAKGTTRIYNCGILATGSSVETDDDGYTQITTNSSTVSGSGYTGGLVGLLDGEARVINCFSYADITGGTSVGGIVGYNNVATTSQNLKTMVMNCMFYGDITGGSNVAPIYNGKNIDNLQNKNGLNTYNYYAYTQLTTKTINTYNCALAVEDKYLNRFEYYRLLLNSNKKLAAFYVTGKAEDADLMAKWVLETADRTIDSPKPYPVLKQQGVFYPSIVNPDITNAPDSTTVGRNHGGKLGKILSVTIATRKTDGGQTWPTGASIIHTSLTLQRTDKDEDRFNFNYDKVQLPYYDEVGEGNYTGNRVVTGWKITYITPVDGDPYTASNYDYTKKYQDNPEYYEFPNYNFADRHSSNKDLYTVSKRVFAQGAYFDVPYGVTAITIEPYWAKCAYLSNPNYDVVYTSGYGSKTDVTATGTQVTVGTTFFDGQGFTTNTSDQRIEKTIANALGYISGTLGGFGPTVYDNAVVLVGNFHQAGVPSDGTNPFTMMSVDLDKDHEPDYSMIYHHSGRVKVCPIRYDFLNIPGTAQAQKPNGASNILNGTIYKTNDWFEITNTSSMYFTQFEYENIDDQDSYDNTDRKYAPLILQGGIFDQFVSTKKSKVDGKNIYIHVGGNAWFHEFGMGTHSDGSQSTPHVPVSVTGGDYDGFYLTGTYNANAGVRTDNAECYISGGRFGELAGASQEQINGNVTWQIYNADITSFFGGGTNDAKPIKGTITTDIIGSYVTTFCGGPKFGNMSTDKAVTTTATDCTFGTFFGAGYGGNSYSRRKYYDEKTPDWMGTLQGYYTSDKGKYYNGSNTNLPSAAYGKKGSGVGADIDYEFFVWSNGATGGRFFVKFVSFSLAQCDDVSSTLTNCTVTGNFYGGGSLGKVAGDVTSTLTNCTVGGNVFGAGYSASLPTIKVRDSGFSKAPNYNKNSGMFEPAVFSGTTEYTWKHVDSYPSEGGDGFDGTQVITTQDLNKSNLGTVTGHVDLTLDGNTTVAGSVYGGGDESYVNNSTAPANAYTTVTLKGNTTVNGNVFGGGNHGVVSGSATVNIEN